MPVAVVQFTVVQTPPSGRGSHSGTPPQHWITQTCVGPQVTSPQLNDPPAAPPAPVTPPTPSPPRPPVVPPPPLSPPRPAVAPAAPPPPAPPPALFPPEPAVPPSEVAGLELQASIRTNDAVAATIRKVSFFMRRSCHGARRRDRDSVGQVGEQRGEQRLEAGRVCRGRGVHA